MKRLLALALSAALSMSVVSCSDSTGPAGGLVGTYTLQSVNNLSLPVTIYSDPTVAEDVLAGRIVLDASGNYSDYLTIRDRYSNGQPAFTSEDRIDGYWSLSGNQLTLTPLNDPNNPSYATVSGNTMTFTEFINGTTFTSVYTR
jgi:hypothetical protein